MFTKLKRRCQAAKVAKATKILEEYAPLILSHSPTPTPSSPLTTLQSQAHQMNTSTQSLTPNPDSEANPNPHQSDTLYFPDTLPPNHFSSQNPSQYLQSDTLVFTGLARPLSESHLSWPTIELPQYRGPYYNPQPAVAAPISQASTPKLVHTPRSTPPPSYRTRSSTPECAYEEREIVVPGSWPGDEEDIVSGWEERGEVVVPGAWPEDEEGNSAEKPRFLEIWRRFRTVRICRYF
ncbi:hypothetical protein K458DRAFT_436157 [Lentithecium fluviatile CBS 122367]|uniref:Uncharacterized protein n=1 Tax=Lentithecium fluviatile CBS 122367 TaxID=1168545 RepID=A0A6G1IIT3_9PLEO|nr:hypothetical protein K458DRAFT_436157 [Lentithecium fluviatile CBS 122367]